MIYIFSIPFFRLNFLQALTAEGKEILYFEEQIGKQ